MFYKATRVSEQWVFGIGKYEIPLDAIRTMTMPILIVMLVLVSYHIGMNNMIELTKWAAYKSQSNPSGNWNPSTNSYDKCYLTAEGLSVKWLCIPQNSTNDYKS